jgi:hypothetical protein
MEKTALNHYQTPWFSSRQGVKIKWNFAMMKSVIQLIFVLWCGVVTCAQDNGKKYNKNIFMAVVIYTE